jgi:hypothetical protein
MAGVDMKCHGLQPPRSGHIRPINLKINRKYEEDRSSVSLSFFYWSGSYFFIISIYLVGLTNKEKRIEKRTAG